MRRGNNNSNSSLIYFGNFQTANFPLLANQQTKPKQSKATNQATG